MKVTTLVLNADGEPHFRSEDQFNIKNLIEFAKDKEQIYRDNGSEWAAGAVSFYVSEAFKAVNTGEHHDFTKAIVNMLMATWLFDSLYCGLTTAHYLESDMEFTITAEGAVMHKRVPVEGRGR